MLWEKRSHRGFWNIISISWMLHTLKLQDRVILQWYTRTERKREADQAEREIIRRWEGRERQETVLIYTPEFSIPPTSSLSKTLVSYFSRNVVTVNAFLLQEHVKTAFVLGQGVTCNSTETHTHSRQNALVSNVFLILMEVETKPALTARVHKGGQSNHVPSSSTTTLLQIEIYIDWHNYCITHHKGDPELCF